MAQSYLESMLGDLEKIEHVTRQHWFLLVSSIIFEIIMILLLLAGTVALAIVLPNFSVLAVAIGFVVILIPIATMTRDILSWTNHQYIVTNRRVIQLSGIIDKTVTDSSLEKVNDVKMTQSALGRIFDFGDIEILTASEMGVNLFRRIEKPIQFKTAMLNAKQRLESGDVQIGGDLGVAGGMKSLPVLLGQLDTLRKQGVLSDEEFQQKKSQLLSRM